MRTNQPILPVRPSRRDFMKTSSAAALGAVAAYSLVVPAVHAAGSDEIKIGLVGCGGRGSGAAVNALKADEKIKLVALGDMFPDKLESAAKALVQNPDVGERVQVKPEMQFHGWDAYKHVIENVDVVLLATPPHFRPMHLRAAIEAGKHVFCEKPVGVDVPGVKHVLETCEIAKKKNLSILSGLCFRYDEAKQQTIAKIHEGAIGDIVNLQGMYNSGPLWMNPRKPEWSDMEWQLRNWLYFTWLSGDHIVEQHIHTLDKMMWIMKDVPPVKVTANGGRTQRTGAEYGHIYDHFDTVYEWENGVRAFCQTRQWNGADTDVSDWAFGTKGKANVMQHTMSSLDGKEMIWKRRPSPQNMYDAEHVVLFKAIRNGTPINNGDYMTKSTLMAIMGRMSAYSGKVVKWDQMMESTESLTPAKYEFGALPTPPVAVPGQSKIG